MTGNMGDDVINTLRLVEVSTALGEPVDENPRMDRADIYGWVGTITTIKW